MVSSSRVTCLGKVQVVQAVDRERCAQVCARFQTAGTPAARALSDSRINCSYLVAQADDYIQGVHLGHPEPVSYLTSHMHIYCRAIRHTHTERGCIQGTLVGQSN